MAAQRAQARELAPQIGVLEARAEDIDEVLILPGGADGKVVGLSRHRGDVPALHDPPGWICLGRPIIETETPAG